MPGIRQCLLLDKPKITGRLAAWMLGVDERKLHEEIARHASADWFMSAMKEQRLAAAIAWSRCRP